MAESASGAPATQRGGTPPATEISPAKEDHFLQLVLRITLDPAAASSPHCQLYYLRRYAEELKQAGKPLKLTRDDFETVIIKRIQDAAAEGSPNVFRFLADSFHRANDEVYSKGLPAALRLEVIQDLQRQLVNYAVLLLSCPELFELGDMPPCQMLEEQLRQFVEIGCPLSFFNRMVDDLVQQGVDSGEDLLKRWFRPVIKALCDGLNLHNMTEYKSPAYNALKFLSGQKPLARLMAEASFLFPEFQRRFPVTKSGLFYQENSLLGRLLAPTLLDGPTLKKGRQESLSMKYFAGNQALTAQYLQATVQTLRHDQQSLQEVYVQIVKNMCRGGSECRHRVVRWYAEILGSNELRAKMSHMLRMTQQQAAESLDPMHAMLLKVQGQTSYGFTLNAFWSLLGLTEPIKMEKLSDICYFYGMRAEDSLAREVLGDLMKDAKLGDDASVAAAERFAREKGLLQAESKFSTEVFLLMLKSLRVLFNPCMAEFTRILQKFQAVHDQGTSPTSPEYRFLIAEIMAWRTVVFHPKFCSLYWHAVHLALAWLLRAVYCFNLDGSLRADDVALVAKQQNRFSTLVLQSCPPPLQAERATRGASGAGRTSPGRGATPSSHGGASASSDAVTVPPQFAALPSALVEDLFTSVRRMLELQSVYLSVRSTQGFEQPPIAAMDAELVAAACIAVMTASEFFRNVHLRCDGACRTLYFMFLTEGVRGRLENTPVVQEHLVRALTDVFIASERGSYYDRITFRIPIVDLFQKLLVADDFKAALHRLGSSSPEKFIHMIHLLLNDVSTLVDQAMSALTEIRKRQLEGRDHDDPPPQANAATTAEGAAEAVGGGSAAAASGAADEQSAEEEEDDDTGASLEGNAQLRRETWSRLEATTRDLCSLGFNACSLFSLYARECGAYIIRSSSILPQAVTTLDCCLDHLVGPRCLQLKVNNMESYNFQPKNWLMKVLESYVYLLQADPEDGAQLVAEILKDGRYFQKETVNKAYRIAKREGLMNVKLLQKFQELVKRLSEGKEEDFEIDYDAFPAEYLDPIMADVMTDPVRLPTSNNIMDRKHIERHLMSEPSDPFNRMPLTKDALIPLPELRQEIMAFIASKSNSAN
ncbi:U-box domain-containing protein [Besnoitia besnoiti]|uniref:RING-type E3 ubiquitin transferase n=1 Tax=Besnoitia besnoiti TaxID=94643 RepID=A0A2A9MK54_BESBE|nr:U-box domain-containing protein [Besnoitia besnoiti]PFH36053.1 U-box domain-containing protein [Besnoitia besnoiti]